jgi:hypothetical protein
MMSQPTSTRHFGQVNAVLESAQTLIPENHTHPDLDVMSLAGVRYGRVADFLHGLYPPQELEHRNALSRTDGYWPFLKNGKNPPKGLTYGEFDFFFFAQVLDQARAYFECQDNSNGQPRRPDWEDKVFVDIGSGVGRLVFAASALHPNWKQCRGIELLPGIHREAVSKLQWYTSRMHEANDVVEDGTDLRRDRHMRGDCVGSDENGSDTKNSQLWLSPIEFVCGSFDDPYNFIGDADCIFVFSSCMPEETTDSLAKVIGRQCRPGTIIITTERMLTLEGSSEPVNDDGRIPFGPFRLSLMGKMDGWCWLTGGASTVFFHKVVESQWTRHQTALQPKELSLQEKAFKVAMALESGELNDPDTFMRNVYNNMAFSGIPERFWPKLYRNKV